MNARIPLVVAAAVFVAACSQQQAKQEEPSEPARAVVAGEESATGATAARSANIPWRHPSVGGLYHETKPVTNPPASEDEDTTISVRPPSSSPTGTTGGNE